MLTEGASNKVIALKMVITELTVKVHMKAILRKLRLQNRTQAAMWARNHVDEAVWAGLSTPAPGWAGASRQGRNVARRRLLSASGLRRTAPTNCVRKEATVTPPCGSAAACLTDAFCCFLKGEALANGG